VLASFRKEGYRIATTARDLHRLQAALRSVPGGEDILAIPADLAVPEEAKAAVQEAVDAFGGRLDVALNLAQAFHQAGVGETSLADLEALIRANLYTTYNLARAVLPVMLAQGGGHIITVAGGSALDPAPGRALFGASKAAVVTLTKGIARDYKQQGVVPVCLVAGTIATPEARQYLTPEEFHWAVSLDEFANALLFLASPRATGFAGSVLELYAREVD